MLGGQELARLRAHERPQHGIAYVPKGRTVFPDTTVEEDLELGAWTVRDLRACQESPPARALVVWASGGAMGGGYP